MQPSAQSFYPGFETNAVDKCVEIEGLNSLVNNRDNIDYNNAEDICYFLSSHSGARNLAKFAVLPQNKQYFYNIKMSLFTSDVNVSMICEELKKRALVYGIYAGLYNVKSTDNYLIVRCMYSQYGEAKNRNVLDQKKKIKQTQLEDFTYKKFVRTVSNQKSLVNLEMVGNFYPNFIRIVNCFIQCLVPSTAKEQKDKYMVKLSDHSNCRLSVDIFNCYTDSPNLIDLHNFIVAWNSKANKNKSWPLDRCTLYVNLYSKKYSFVFEKVGVKGVVPRRQDENVLEHIKQ